MSPREKDMEIEYRIINEAILDARPEEQAMSWYYYLEDKMDMPFKAECRLVRKTSPLQPGEVVTVKKMPGEDECEKEMFVTVDWQDRELTVPLIQLQPLDVEDDTLEAIGDWHYWMERGYQLG